MYNYFQAIFYLSTDEMGLGKTIMAITLILHGKTAAREDTENWFTPQNKKLVPSRATLVVCPVGCIEQWDKELKTKAKGLQVLMFHGSNRIKSAALLSQNDVVITTYPTLCKFDLQIRSTDFNISS